MSWYGLWDVLLAFLPFYDAPPRWAASQEFGISMNRAVRRRFTRVDKVLASIAEFFKNFFPATGGAIGSQRMCPFCGLITSSRKTHCLECGKVLKPA